MAAGKEIGRARDPAGAGQRLEVRIVSRLIVVRGYVEGKKVGIVVGTGNIAIESEVQPVVRFDLRGVSIVSLITGGEHAASFQFRVFPDLHLGRGEWNRQKKQKADEP